MSPSPLQATRRPWSLHPRCEGSPGRGASWRRGPGPGARSLARSTARGSASEFGLRRADSEQPWSCSVLSATLPITSCLLTSWTQPGTSHRSIYQGSQGYNQGRREGKRGWMKQARAFFAGSRTSARVLTLHRRCRISGSVVERKPAAEDGRGRVGEGGAGFGKRVQCFHTSLPCLLLYA